MGEWARARKDNKINVDRLVILVLVRLVFIRAKHLYSKKEKRPADAASAMKCESAGVFALNVAPLLCGDADGVIAAGEDPTVGAEVAARASAEDSTDSETEGSGADISVEDSVVDSES